MRVLNTDSCKIAALYMMIVFLVFGGAFPAKAESSGKILVFAAASTTNAIEDIARLFSQQNAIRVVTSFASSSTLAKQIEAGAPADIFISANPEWMDFLEDKGLIKTHTRHDLLGNRVVLIAPAASEVKIDIHPGFKLAQILGKEKIAMGDPDHVPAGIYGRQALKFLGVWEDIQSGIVRAKDVRTALVFVERAEVPLGLVYATDAAISQKVRVVGVFPENSHPEITYPAALVKSAHSEVALKFFDFLKSSEAKAVFKKYGFFVK
ncbi:MAG: molybdate ABC transporter substrate-binding protein [Proteobacteria bacterium]|nr:molybdate ABC transporter substrate-binding protein [Pseudomonadota bacterium]MBU1389866.1 molybdate ABC transporter substrate-binding protein [Pseudomonadota bacterium]MBU1543875.1 molybdate ABC transporter substrate-binding protein [Pseudomonadota bacterium]MBU2482228.1 molybdate ABC transporter substrate-binding protein [Pseudomonadota bacterium]